jgi:CHAT domain-containing protein
VDAEIPAELAVMSACQTGLGRNVSGEGLLGMSWSWFAAGVPSTVASQWSVGDASTAKLMKAFYARLKAGDSKAEALQQAELTLLKDPSTRHPFYWAPFVLVGDDK